MGNSSTDKLAHYRDNDIDPTSSRPSSRGRAPAKLQKEDRKASVSHLDLPPKNGDVLANRPKASSPPSSYRHPNSGTFTSSDGSLESRGRQDTRSFSAPGTPIVDTSQLSRQKTNTYEQEKKAKRRSWLPTSRNASQAYIPDTQAPRAWIAGHAAKNPYRLTPLIQAQKVSELWDEEGDTLVFLFPKASGKGASFKVNSSLYGSSPTLTHIAAANLHSHRHGPTRRRSDSQPRQTPKQTPTELVGDDAWKSNNNSSGSTQMSSSGSSGSRSSRRGRASDDSLDSFPRLTHLYVPVLSTGALSAAGRVGSEVTHDDVEALIAVRNLFAFLLGQSIVATEGRPTIYQVFLKISESLKIYGFTNLDGSTFGEISAASFDSYADELGLADVRFSREKTIEGVVLGERMRSVLLYNEAFVHAIGKYTDLQDVITLESSATKYNAISPVTRTRMDRAHIDLVQREKSINTRLTNFEFPSIFAGVLDSRMADERKELQFGAWKDAFLATRKHVLGYYKQHYGSWPPKAKSKKNNLETSGLNRSVIRNLYSDFATVYDLYVDRSSLTTRSKDMMSDEGADDPEEPIPRILRRVFDEYDRSYPPVQPPVPFDTPLLPQAGLMTGTKVRPQKFKGEDLTRTLTGSSNRDVLALTTAAKSPFLSSLRQFELKQGSGHSVTELVNFRCGMWIFIYAVLQALPMLAVDAPAVRFHEGVEYFLCEPPRGGVPWASVDAGTGRGRTSRAWYGIGGGAGLVSLPSDLIEHGVYGVYHRSHCWVKARQWSGGANGGITESPISEEPQAIAGSRVSSGRSSVRTSKEHSRNTSASLLSAPNLGPRFGDIINGPAPTTKSQPISAYQPIMIPQQVMAGTSAPSPLRQRSRPPSRDEMQPRIPLREESPRETLSRDAPIRGPRRESVLALGLQALPLPGNVAPSGAGIVPRSRPTTAHDGQRQGSQTFDDILASMGQSKMVKKK